MKTAVLFLIFNRPETTIRVFEAIALARPSRLYVAADGPRSGKTGEEDLCREVRQIAAGVDWPCEVRTLLRESNLGCKKAVSTAIDWFFEQEEDGIILEDDCLPHQDFFPFCEELLDRYRDDARVMQICGSNYRDGMAEEGESYYFTQRNHIWGWASWRRAWSRYDLGMKRLGAFRDRDALAAIVPDSRYRRWLYRTFQAVADGKIDTWDYQWIFAIWAEHGLSIQPDRNLVTNIGFGAGATHTGESNKALQERPNFPLNWPLIPPVFVLPNRASDGLSLSARFNSASLPVRIVKKIRSVLGMLRR